MLSLSFTSIPLSGSFDDEQVDSSPSIVESVEAFVFVVTTSGEAGFGSNRDGVNGFSSTRGDTRQGLSLENNDIGFMGGSSEELVLPLASIVRAVSLLLSVSSSATISSVSLGGKMAFFLGRPRGRFAGVGASSESSFPSSRPESLSGALCITVEASFVVGAVAPPPPLRVLIRTFGRMSELAESVMTGTVGVGVVDIGLTGTGVTLLKLLLLLLLDVPFFSASVSGSSMIIQSELDPSSFSISRTLVMLLDVGIETGIGSTAGMEIGGADDVGCLRSSTEAGIAWRAAVRLGRGST